MSEHTPEIEALADWIVLADGFGIGVEDDVLAWARGIQGNRPTEANAKARDVIASHSRAAEAEAREIAKCHGQGPTRPCNSPVHPGYTVCPYCLRTYTTAQLEAALLLPENASFRKRK